MKALLVIFTAVCVLLPNLAYAQATVFVPSEASAAWWIRDLKFLPRDKKDEGLSISAINSWLGKNRGMKPEHNLCYMNFVDERDVVSSDRKTDAEIATDLAKYPGTFRQIYEPEQGTKFLVRIGVFEGCEDKESATQSPAFMALVITDESGAVKEFDALQWNFIRLFKRNDGKLNVLGCFACGEVQELLWDKFNDRFYFNWIGH